MTDNCVSEPCQNSANCTNQLDAYKCQCEPGKSTYICVNRQRVHGEIHFNFFLVVATAFLVQLSAMADTNNFKTVC